MGGISDLNRRWMGGQPVLRWMGGKCDVNRSRMDGVSDVETY